MWNTIEGLSPAISIDQKNDEFVIHVQTSERYGDFDYLRLLFAPNLYANFVQIMDWNYNHKQF